VLFVCQWYSPEPVSQPGWIVSALRRRGADVEVLTGIPNYPTGKVVDGYRAWRSRADEVDGVRVWRTPLYPSHDSRPLRRFLNYASWAISSAVLGVRRFRSADVALVYSSPATAALPAMLAKLLFAKPYVLLVQDVWPDSIFDSGFLRGRTGRLARRLVGAFASLSYMSAASVVVISPGMVGLLESRGVPAHKLRLIYNWVDEGGAVDRTARDAVRAELGLTVDDFVVMYAGNHGSAQGLGSLVRAFSQVPPQARCHLVMVGDGMEKTTLQEQAGQEAAHRVHFMQPQPRERMLSLMAAADVQLVSLVDSPLFAATTPSKLQSIMAAGHPALVSARGDAADVVRNIRSGVAVRPGDTGELVAAILHLRETTVTERRAMGERGRAYYVSQMSEEVGASRLVTTLREAAATGRPKWRPLTTPRRTNDRMRA
jgi:glycosyltransferase involved in cell wall biosynthesis